MNRLLFAIIAATVCGLCVLAHAGEPRALLAGDTVHTTQQYPVGSGERWSSGPFVLLRRHEKKGWVWATTLAGEQACIDTHYVDWSKSPSERDALSEPAKSAPAVPEWRYVPLHGGNGRLAKLREHRAIGGAVSIEIDEWTYDGVTNGKGPSLYVRAEKLDTVLAGIRDRNDHSTGTYDFRTGKYTPAAGHSGPTPLPPPPFEEGRK